jgi:hypothetical protein
MFKQTLPHDLKWPDGCHGGHTSNKLCVRTGSAPFCEACKVSGRMFTRFVRVFRGVFARFSAQFPRQSGVTRIRVVATAAACGVSASVCTSSVPVLVECVWRLHKCRCSGVDHANRHCCRGYEAAFAFVRASIRCRRYFVRTVYVRSCPSGPVDVNVGTSLEPTSNHVAPLMSDCSVAQSPMQATPLEIWATPIVGRLRRSGGNRRHTL